MADRPPPHHPLRRTGVWISVCGALMPLAALQFDAGAPSVILFGALGAFCLWSGVQAFRSAGQVSLINDAYDLDARGLHEEAEALRRRIESTLPGSLRSALCLQRALASLARGELEVVRELTTRVVEAQPWDELVASEACLVERNYAHGIRAIAAAGLGDEYAARQDAMDVRTSVWAHPEALAFVEVSEAVLLARKGADEALGDHLRRHRVLLKEHVCGQLRGLVGALEAGLEDRATSAYRAPAVPEEEHDAAAPAPILEALAPGVRAIAPGRALRGAAAVPLLTASRSVAPRAPLQTLRAQPLRWRPLLAWAGVLVVFFTIWSFFNPPPSASPRARRSNVVVHDEATDDDEGTRVPVRRSSFRLPSSAGRWMETVTSSTAMLLVGGVSVFFLRRRRRLALRLAFAHRLHGEGRDDEAEAKLVELLDTRAHMIVGNARLLLAAIAVKRADFAAAIEHTQRGLARVEASALAHDLLTPDLVATRALAFAALGRHAESAAEAQVLLARHPAFPHRSSRGLAIGLVGAVVRRDTDAAVALAEQRTSDLTLPWYVEVLADAVEATAHARPAEAMRVARLLRDDAVLRGWLETLWPGVVERLDEASRSVG